MNTRIRELVGQAKFMAEETTNKKISKNAELDAFAEKFAELIVKEYEKLLPEICPWADADKEGSMKGWHVQFVARKHFGIEE